MESHQHPGGTHGDHTGDHHHSPSSPQSHHTNLHGNEIHASTNAIPMDPRHRHQHHHHHHHHHHNHHHGHSPGADPDPSGVHFDPSGSQGHQMAHQGHQMAHMKPAFQWVTNVPVLFHDWTTETAIELALAMLTAAFLAAAYEWLRHGLLVWDSSIHASSTTPRWKRTCLRVSRSLVHALTAAVSYLQMLFAMTYDLRIFIAIILGSGVGFFILGPYFRQMKLARKMTQGAFADRKGGYVWSANGDESGSRLIETGGKDDDDRWGVGQRCGGGEGGNAEDGGGGFLSSLGEVDRETVL